MRHTVRPSLRWLVCTGLGWPSWRSAATNRRRLRTTATGPATHSSPSRLSPAGIFFTSQSARIQRSLTASMPAMQDSSRSMRCSRVTSSQRPLCSSSSRRDWSMASNEVAGWALMARGCTAARGAGAIVLAPGEAVVARGRRVGATSARDRSVLRRDRGTGGAPTAQGDRAGQGCEHRHAPGGMRERGLHRRLQRIVPIETPFEDPGHRGDSGK